MHILVVEDNAENLEILERRLSRQGYKISTANDGEQAVEFAKIIKPDLILMDVSMPIMSGLEATQIIRQTEEISNTLIIALTAHAMEGDREKCIEAGCDDFATKPVNFKNLTALINNMLTELAEAKNIQNIESV